jgi:hypothetical protein
MVYAINCGADGAPNSFANFKNAALAVGASARAAAPPQTSTTPVYTAAYGDITIPPPPPTVEVTTTVTVDGSSWATTYTQYPNAPGPTPVSLGGNVINVVVGGPGKLIFDPSHVVAHPRDKIRFELWVQSFSITTSRNFEFLHPTQPPKEPHRYPICIQ